MNQSDRPNNNDFLNDLGTQLCIGFYLFVRFFFWAFIIVMIPGLIWALA